MSRITTKDIFRNSQKVVKKRIPLSSENNIYRPLIDEKNIWLPFKNNHKKSKNGNDTFLFYHSDDPNLTLSLTYFTSSIDTKEYLFVVYRYKSSGGEKVIPNLPLR